MLQRVQEKNVLGGLGYENMPRLRGASKALAQWAIVDDYDTVLDLQCEDALLLSFLSQKYSLRACGICSDAERARSLRLRMPQAEVFCARKEDIPWRDDTFNAVFYQMKTSQPFEDGAFMREAARVLRPGGQMLVAARWMPGVLRSSLCALGAADAEELPDRARLLGWMEEAGLRDVSWRVTGPLHAVAMGWKKS